MLLEGLVEIRQSGKTTEPVAGVASSGLVNVGCSCGPTGADTARRFISIEDLGKVLVAGGVWRDKTSLVPRSWPRRTPAMMVQSDHRFRFCHGERAGLERTSGTRIDSRRPRGAKGRRGRRVTGLALLACASATLMNEASTPQMRLKPKSAGGGLELMSDFSNW